MFKDCQTFLSHHHGAESIDYFLARELSLSLGAPEQELLFYSIVAVNTALRAGHTCLLISKWAGYNPWYAEQPLREGYLLPDHQKWHNYLVELELTPESGQPLVYDRQRLYLRRYWLFEQQLAKNLLNLQSEHLQIEPVQAKKILNKLFSTDTTSEIDWQKVAVTNAILNRFSIIAGGPGTGKTTTITKLLATLLEIEQKPLEIKMAAPTGMAAQRLMTSISKAKQDLVGTISSSILEQIPEKASTIHHLLGVRRYSTEFWYNRDNPLPLDLLLIDEFSMVDLPLMNALFSALPAESRVILLGDANQLPSVASGSLLADLAPYPHRGFSPERAKEIKEISAFMPQTNQSNPTDHLTFLTKSYRFKEGGGIGKLAKLVIQGKAEQSWQQLQKEENELKLVQTDNFQEWIESQANLYYQKIASVTSVVDAFKLFSKFRFLTATRQGNRGVERINRIVEDLFRPGRSNFESSEFYHGRPVMILKNYPELNLFNGDIGLVWKRNGKIQVAFRDTDNKIRWISLGRLPQVETIYAMTIHKTQGSEMDEIALILPEYKSQLLTRELIYTAITRARKRVEVVCNYEIWKFGVDKKVGRFSGLSELLNQ